MYDLTRIEPDNVKLSDIFREDIATFVARIEDQCVVPEELNNARLALRTRYFTAAVSEHVLIVFSF